MDFLLENPLTQINGPGFLILYGFVIVLSAISLGLYRTQLDKTDMLPLPAIPPQPDPFEIAFLRGGVNEFARAVIFALVNSGQVTITTDDTSSALKPAENAAQQSRLSPIEADALNWVGTGREVKDVFDTNSGLVSHLERHATALELRLSERQMIADGESTGRLRKFSIAAILLIVGIALYRLFTSILHGEFNIIFLIVLGVIGSIVLGKIGTLPRVTKRGKAYLERLRVVFEDLQYAPRRLPGAPNQLSPQAATAGVDPVLVSVAVFGTGVLAGTPFSGYTDAFQRAQQQNAASSGGCGSACGSCSSGGDGGGGCGGGCGGD